jgi:outer membrane protein OmpA-like peptidoglycan-associated protein
MKRIAIPILLTAAMAITVGCTTKKEVSREVTPVMNKVDQLDERTAQTTRGIHDTDARAQSGIAGVDAKAAAADQKAQAAGQQADQAQQLATSTNAGVSDLTNRVVNFDNYHPVTETAVHFGFDRAVLTAKDKGELDEIGSQIPTVKNYIVQIEGRTDSAGNADYNYQLSQRRAAAVTQYLASKYGVPPHKIFIIGLGKDQPVEQNSTSRGRAENRRVDVRLMTNTLEEPQAAEAGQTAPAVQQPMPPATASPAQ